MIRMICILPFEVGTRSVRCGMYSTYLSIGDVDVDIDRSSSVKCREDMGRSMVELAYGMLS